MNDTEARRVGDKRQRRLAARRERILVVALEIAESEGWDAVTTRRVADDIDFSQPVIYQHFSSREELIHSIAVKGFVRLTEEIHSVHASQSPSPLEELCYRYVDFGLTNPRLYEAMFLLPTTARFATADTPAEMRASFDALVSVVAPNITSEDAESAAELLWAACHGITTLRIAERIPASRIDQHIARIVSMSVRPT